jgi:hypothetical protein
VGRWSGSFERDTTIWMRFYTPEGELVVTHAEQEAHRAEQAERRAEQEAQRAEQETQRAEQEAQRAEQAERRAEQETQRVERLAAQLRAMGIEPDVDESDNFHENFEEDR